MSMDKWEEILQIRQDRIDELKQDNKRLRERLKKQDEHLKRIKNEMKIHDREGNEIKDGDCFEAWVQGKNNPPIKGKRKGNKLHWEDGLVQDIEEYWYDDTDNGIFKVIECDE